MSNYSISILGSDSPVDVLDDESILDGCLEAGVSLPYNCRSGECGECIARLVSGKVKELSGADPAVFNDTHRADGLVLTCMCYPRSDLVLSTQLAQKDAPTIGEFDAVVKSIRRHGPAVFEITVETAISVMYRPGQYFDWALPGITPNRSYSAANRPGTGHIVFHVRAYEQGQVSRYLTTEQLGVGDMLTLKGPFGNFGFSSHDYLPAVMVAGGTGLAPICALLDEMFTSGSMRSVQLFFGAQLAQDLYHLEKLEAWASANPNFRFVPAVSGEQFGSNWTGERGLVTEVMTRRLSDMMGVEAYLCGPPRMIDAAISLLQGLGASPEDIYYDKFTAVSGRG